MVSLSSNSPAVSVPATMTVPAGVWSASVPLTTTAVTATTVATITATYNGVSQQATVTVTPPRPPASVTINPTSRIGSDPGTATGLVNIASFSAYDQTFQLTSSNPAVASVPATATVTAGFLARRVPDHHERRRRDDRRDDHGHRRRREPVRAVHRLPRGHDAVALLGDGRPRRAWRAAPRRRGPWC